MIQPRYQGIFYEKEYVALVQQMEELYESSLGPGALPLRRKEQKISAVIVPHDHYMLSGAAQAWAYKVIAESSFPKRYIFLLPDQNGTAINIQSTFENIETSIGICQIDKEFLHELTREGIVTATKEFVSQALELQLPFLQHASKDNIHSLKIVPLIIPPLQSTRHLSHILQGEKESVIICVTNFTRYGERYHYTPFKFNIMESIENLDMFTAKLILDKEEKMLRKYIQKQQIQCSGKEPLFLLTEILSQFIDGEGEVLCYYKSSEINNDEKNSVSYMSIVF